MTYYEEQVFNTILLFSTVGDKEVVMNAIISLDIFCFCEMFEKIIGRD